MFAFLSVTGGVLPPRRYGTAERRNPPPSFSQNIMSSELRHTADGKCYSLPKLRYETFTRTTATPQAEWRQPVRVKHTQFLSVTFLLMKILASLLNSPYNPPTRT